MSVENGFDKPAKPEEEKEKSEIAKETGQENSVGEKRGIDEPEKSEVKEMKILIKELYPEFERVNLSARDIESGKIIFHVLNGARQNTSSFPQAYEMLKGKNEEQLQKYLNLIKKVKVIDERLIGKMDTEQKEAAKRINRLLEQYNELIEQKDEKELEEVYQETKRIDNELKNELMVQQRPDFHKEDKEFLVG